MKNPICPYCHNLSEYVDSSIVYGRSYGMMYLCTPCDAYVGVHKGTDDPLGSLANRELREARKQAHYYFDQIARTSLINAIWKVHFPKTSNRKKAYKWLAIQMNVREDDCHIGMFNVEQCQQVVEISKKYIQ